MKNPLLTAKYEIRIAQRRNFLHPRHQKSDMISLELSENPSRPLSDGCCQEPRRPCGADLALPVALLAVQRRWCRTNLSKVSTLSHWQREDSGLQEAVNQSRLLTVSHILRPLHFDHGSHYRIIHILQSLRNHYIIFLLNQSFE